MCFLERIFYAIKNNPAVFVSFLALLVTIGKIWWDKYLEEEKKNIEKRENYEYFISLLYSLINRMKEQVEYYKSYSDGLESSFYGSNSYEKNTFINMDMFLKFDQNKFYKAYLFHFKEKGIEDTKSAIENFEKIYENVSEFDDINKANNEYYFEYVDSLTASTNKIKDEYKRNIFTSIGKLVSTNPSTFNMKLYSFQDELINKSMTANDEIDKEVETQPHMKRFKKHNLQLSMLYDFTIKVVKEIKNSELLHIDENVTFIFYEGLKLADEYESMVSKRSAAKNLFLLGNKNTETRYKEIERIIKIGV